MDKSRPSCFGEGSPKFKKFRKDSLMKKNSFVWIVLFVLLGALLNSACSATAAQPVQALAGTEAATQVAAQSSSPAEAPDSAAPTPSRMEFAVENAKLVVKIMDIGK